MQAGLAIGSRGKVGVQKGDYSCYVIMEAATGHENPCTALEFAPCCDREDWTKR